MNGYVAATSDWCLLILNLGSSRQADGERAIGSPECLPLVRKYLVIVRNKLKYNNSDDYRNDECDELLYLRFHGAAS